MSPFHSSPDPSGIIAIIVSVVVVSIIITLVAKTFLHWVPVTAAIVVALWAVQAISR